MSLPTSAACDDYAEGALARRLFDDRGSFTRLFSSPFHLTCGGRVDLTSRIHGFLCFSGKWPTRTKRMSSSTFQMGMKLLVRKRVSPSSNPPQLRSKNGWLLLRGRLHLASRLVLRKPLTFLRTLARERSPLGVVSRLSLTRGFARDSPVLVSRCTSSSLRRSVFVFLSLTCNGASLAGYACARPSFTLTLWRS